MMYKIDREGFNLSLRNVRKKDVTFIKGGDLAKPHDAIRLKIVTNEGAAMLRASIERLSRGPLETYPPALRR